jgi:putative salt-induced outer membrane protein YdiY
MRIRPALLAVAVVFGLATSLLAQSNVAPMPPMTLNFDIPKAKMGEVKQAQAEAPIVPQFVNDAAGGLFPVEKPPKIWSGGGEVGLNGAEGNSKLFNLRAGFNAKRKTTDNLLVTDFLYSYAEQNSLLTQNQMLFNARDEILFAGTPWSAFAATNIEYDQLRSYRFRVGLYGGVGYQLVDNEKMNWRVRAGAGAVYEIAGYTGGPDSRWVPEMLLGTDFSYKFDDRQSFESVVDYFPRIDDWSQFRLRARVAYAIILDKEMGITLRLGAQNRYDSSPGTANANDLTYFATLGFSF